MAMTMAPVTTSLASLNSVPVVNQNNSGTTVQQQQQQSQLNTSHNNNSIGGTSATTVNNNNNNAVPTLTTTTAGGVVVTNHLKLAPRIIISPQMISTRPGQPGVEEYQSEFSEFLMLNYKQNVHEESEDNCVTDHQHFQKSVQNVDELSKCSNSILQHESQPGAIMEHKQTDGSELNPSSICLSKSSSESDLPSESLSSSTLLLPPLTQNIVDQIVLSPQKSDCSTTDLTFLPASPPSIQYDVNCVQAQTEQSNLPESIITGNNNNNVDSNSGGGDGDGTRADIDTNFSSHEATFYRGDEIDQQHHHNNNSNIIVYSNSNNNSGNSTSINQQTVCQILPEDPKLASCQLSSNSSSERTFHHQQEQSYHQQTSGLDADTTSDLLLSSCDPEQDHHQFIKDSYDRETSTSLIVDHHHQATSMLPATTTVQSYIDLGTSSSPIMRYSPAATVVTASTSGASPGSIINSNNATATSISSYSSSTAVSVLTTTTTASIPHQAHHVKLNPQYQTSPIHIRIPPHQHYQQQQQQQQPQQEFNSSKSLMSPEYKSPKCFTTDAQLQSQFIHYNAQHPITVPHGNHSITSKTTTRATADRVPLIQSHQTHPSSSSFPSHSYNQNNHNHHRESNNVVHPTGYNSQGEGIHSVTGNIYSSSRSSHELASVQHGPTSQLGTYSPSRSTLPSSIVSSLPSPSGCDYFPPSNSSIASPYPLPHPSQTNIQHTTARHEPLHHYTNHPPHHHNIPSPLPPNRSVNIPHQHHSPTIPLLSPTRPSMISSSTQLPSPTSYNSNGSPRWMTITSSNNRNSVSHTKDQGSHVIRYHPNVPMSRGGIHINSPQTRFQTPTAIIPQSSPPSMACQYRVPYHTSHSSSGAIHRYPIPRPSPPNNNHHHQHQGGGQNAISGVIASSGNVDNNSVRIQNVGHQYPSYAHDHYNRHSNNNSNNSYQHMQGQSQYYHHHQVGNTQNAPTNSNSSTLGMVTSGSQSSGGYPLVCRVSPIRSRYDGPSPNYPINSFPQGQQHHASPSLPSPISIPNPYSAQDQNFNRQVLLGASGKHDFNYPYENQYNDARNLRPQITLQALPGGLPPGAQGHHLLVKTETGQYQLLRVGMPTQPQAPTTASGTIPHPVPNNNSSITTSVAQQSSAAPIISSTQSVSSTVISGLQPTTNNITMAGATNVAATPSPGGLNSIMANAVTTTRHPMTNNLVNTNGISSVSSSIVSSSPSAISSTTIPSPLPTASPIATATYRLQTVPSVPPTAASNSQQVHPQLNQPVQGSPVPTNVSATANSVSQMTAETAKMKCKNFLSFLLELSAKQNVTVARNVKTLIQGLVDGKVNAEDFSDRLQREVNSQPQPCLVGFLKKSLPHLRQSLATKELTIDGIRPPALSSIAPTTPITALIPQNQVRPQALPTPVRIITPINSTAPSPTSNSPIPRSTAAAVQQRFSTPTKTSSNSSRNNASNKVTAVTNASSVSNSPATVTVSSNLHTKSSGPFSSKSGSKEKDKKGAVAAAAAFSGYSGDDDINDVAAMGGVNLAEESQRILGSTEFVGTQIRSCKDESFLPAMLLQSRIKATAAKFGLEDCSSEVAAMISHATEERLKNLLEKLSVIAEHRLDVIKVDERYEVSQDVKGQLRFLEELDKLERKRHDEQEREILIKAAKSRSKSEDPEQAKLKAKAKEMQRVAMEELRQREANLTALQAIGPRKKPKLDTPTGSQITTAQTQLGGQGASSRQIGLRPRLKRVNLRDLLFLMEQDKETQRSHFLYKNLLLK